jgi:hypothetical protein
MVGAHAAHRTADEAAAARSAASSTSSRVCSVRRERADVGRPAVGTTNSRDGGAWSGHELVPTHARRRVDPGQPQHRRRGSDEPGDLAP